MSRMPEIDYAKLSAEQKKVHDAVVAGPRGKIVGPIKVWLKNPGLAEHAQALGALRPLRHQPRAAPVRACDLLHRRVLEGELRVVRARPARPEGRHRARRARSDPHRRQADLHQGRRADDLRFRHRAAANHARVRRNVRPRQERHSARPA